MERILKSAPVIKPVDPQMARPLWSVMIPSYNCIAHLHKTLNSVLMQDPGPDKMQIEVIDDCSSDGDVEKLVYEIGKGRISFFRQEKNMGHHRNFETCLNRSKGQYVHLLHGDDMVKPGFYKEIEMLFYENPAAGAAFTNNEYMDENDQLVYKPQSITKQRGILPDFLVSIAQKQMLQFSAMVVKRKVYEHLGGFYFVNYCEDWHMWIRIAAHYPIAYSPALLALYRSGLSNAGSITSNSLLSGDNFRNIKKVINISQEYLPPEKRRYIKTMAKKNYAEHIARAAKNMYWINKKVAFRQGLFALKMYQSPRTIYLFGKLILLYVKDQAGLATSPQGPVQVSVSN